MTLPSLSEAEPMTDALLDRVRGIDGVVSVEANGSLLEVGCQRDVSADIAAAVERQPRSVRGVFWMELARSCDETMLQRFFRLTAAERDTEGDQR